jgi:hypothetical protein
LISFAPKEARHTSKDRARYALVWNSLNFGGVKSWNRLESEILPIQFTQRRTVLLERYKSRRPLHSWLLLSDCDSLRAVVVRYLLDSNSWTLLGPGKQFAFRASEYKKQHRGRRKLAGAVPMRKSKRN